MISSDEANNSGIGKCCMTGWSIFTYSLWPGSQGRRCGSRDVKLPCLSPLQAEIPVSGQVQSSPEAHDQRRARFSPLA
eukprot:scaffold161974_cov42-Prasinocladus_malaysianus.AAC.1